MSHGDSWSCIMVEDGPGTISDEVRMALKMAACELYLDKLDRKLIDNEVCDGVIETAWKTKLVGTRSGVLFHAHIVGYTTDGYKVNFLLETADLDRGADYLRELKERESLPFDRGLGLAPCPDLYEFHDLRTIRKKMLN